MTDDKRNPLGDAFADPLTQELLGRLAKGITAEDLKKVLGSLRSKPDTLTDRA